MPQKEESKIKKQRRSKMFNKKKIEELEDQIRNMERDIAGLKMEADVLYAKTLERE
jgi:TolA-binding protein